jgi:hypothetical protein
MSLLFAVAWLAPAQAGDPALKIPPVKTSIVIEGQAIGIAVWGTVSGAPSGIFRLAMTADLGNLQENLTAVLAARLNRSDRCGERISLERAALAPAEPSGVLTAYMHYERFACAKAFGKEVVKRIAGGDAVVEAVLTPSVGENGIALAAEVRKIDAGGSLGELLRSGSFGDSLRERVAAGIESALRKSASLKSIVPAEMESAASIQSARFADGGAGRLWLAMSGEVRLGAEQFRDAAKKLAR